MDDGSNESNHYRSKSCQECKGQHLVASKSIWNHIIPLLKKKWRPIELSACPLLGDVLTLEPSRGSILFAAALPSAWGSLESPLEVAPGRHHQEGSRYHPTRRISVVTQRCRRETRRRHIWSSVECSNSEGISGDGCRSRLVVIFIDFAWGAAAARFFRLTTLT
jgi:hypothetical protein